MPIDRLVYTLFYGVYMIDLERPDVKRFYDRIVRVERVADDLSSGECWEYRGKINLDGNQGARRVAWYLAYGTFGEKLAGQVEGRCGNRVCCNPAHSKFIRYLSAEEKAPRAERDKKIRLLRGRGWKNRFIADELGVSMGIVRRVLKDD